MLFLILLGDLNFPHLVSHIVKTLFLKLAHEVELALQLVEEKLLVNAVELSFHAQADEGCHMHITFCNHDIFAADDTATSKGRNLVQSMLLACRLGAHVFALAGQLARTLFRLFQHLIGIQPLQFLVHCESNLAREKAFLYDVDVLERVVLVKDGRALDD